MNEFFAFLISGFATFIVSILFVQSALYMHDGSTLSDTWDNIPYLIYALIGFSLVGGLIAVKIDNIFNNLVTQIGSNSVEQAGKFW